MYADTTKAAPESFTCEMQPYGVYTIQGCTWGSYNGFPFLTGTVSKGTETSRLFSASVTDSIKGQTRTIYGVRQSELEVGHCIRVAM